MSDIKKWMEIVAGAERLSANILNFNVEPTENTASQSSPNITINLNVGKDGEQAEVDSDTAASSPVHNFVPKGSSLPVEPEVPAPVTAPPSSFKKDDTVTIVPSSGGGIGRFQQYTKNGALVDIKGVLRELSVEEFLPLKRDYEDPYEQGNKWSHSTVTPDTIGTMNDKPEFRPGDMVRVQDVYGAVIGPGFGVFVAYSTSGEEAIISQDNRQIVVPIKNVVAIKEQEAKNNFSETDNDGNLSPMSLGKENLKIEEAVMDQKDEFSKWMSAVEEALKTDAPIVDEEILEQGACGGCGAWDCPECFPEQDGTDATDGETIQATIIIPKDALQGVAPVDQGIGDMDDVMASDEVETEIPFDAAGGIEFNEGDPVDDFISGGGQVQQLPYMNKPRKPGMEFGSKHIGSAAGRETSRGALRGSSANVSQSNNASQKPVVGEEDTEFVEKPKSGKGVKLGNIVQTTRIEKTGGQNSPMTYGDDNLAEGPENEFAGHEEAADMIDSIMNMQGLGLSKDNVQYSMDQLANMPPEELKAAYDKVMGDVSEATNGPKPTKTKKVDPFGADDLTGAGDDSPLTNVPSDDGEFNDVLPDPSMPAMPVASADSTRRATSGMNPSSLMRDFMSRIDPNAGGDEAELPDTMGSEIVARTAQDVPAVISSALQASGTQNPEWHTVNNLPGYRERNIRGMGRQIFGMFTSTPLEQIQTMANVDGQGPNTPEEMRAVGSWLMSNAEDLGTVDLSHGQAIPGYKPDVKEYRINGVRFHVVRDPMGQYIYAYPDADARTNTGQGRLDRPEAPRLREGDEMNIKPTLFEQLKWDEEINEAFIAESSLSKLIGKQKGGQNLVKWLHRKHKLGNDANLEPAPFSTRMLWKEYKRNPDNFIVVSATNGVAGIKPYEDFIKKRAEEFRKKGKDYDPGGDSTVPYQIIAFTDDGEQIDPSFFKQKAKPGDEEEKFSDPTVTRARMGLHNGRDMQNPDNTFNLLADKIGALRTVYVASGGVERDKMGKRADMKKGAADLPNEEAMQQVFQRVRPVLKKLASQAESYLMRAAKRAFDGKNFVGAQKLAGNADKLTQFIASIDKTGDIRLSGTLQTQIARALTKASGSYPGAPEYTEFLNKAARGSAIELKPVLDALRDELVGLT